MTVANDLIFLALRTSNINGIGQTPMAEDVNNALTILNNMIGVWRQQRRVLVITPDLPLFPDLYTDVPFWTPYEGVLLPNLSALLRMAWGLPADEALGKVADGTLQVFQANNQQQVAPLHPGMPTTCLQAIFLALRMAGRINDQQSVADGSKDVDDAMSLLRMMMAQWQRKRWLVWDEQETVLTSTGQDHYTIGAGGDFNVPRPDRIENAYARLLSGTSTTMLVDFPLGIIEAKEDYAKIQLKSLPWFPVSLWYDSAYPLGSIYFWPIPQAGLFDLHVNTKTALPTLTSTASALAFPPEYIDALVTNLACRIMIASGQRPAPDLVSLARSSLNTIRMANLQIPTSSMPSAVSGPRRSGVAASADPAFVSGMW